MQRYICRITPGIAAALAGLVLAACGGDTPTQPPVTAALSAVSVNPATVTAPTAVQGTVSLTAAAPTGGASVSLSSSSAAATVPASVVVPAGSSTMTFQVTTSASGGGDVATITASYQGVQRTVTVTVNSPAVANFSVVSNQAARSSNVLIPGLGAGTADACPLAADGANRVLRCDMMGGASASTAGPIASYEWTLKIGTRQLIQTTSSPTLSNPFSDCGFFGGNTTTGTTPGSFIQLIVDLKVRDTQNNISAVRTNGNVRVFPQNNCGYAF